MAGRRNNAEYPDINNHLNPSDSSDGASVRSRGSSVDINNNPVENDTSDDSGNLYTSSSLSYSSSSDLSSFRSPSSIISSQSSLSSLLNSVSLSISSLIGASDGESISLNDNSNLQLSSTTSGHQHPLWSISSYLIRDDIELLVDLYIWFDKVRFVLLGLMS